MEAWMDALLLTLALPKVGLLSVFVISFVSATLLPMGSEPALFGFVSLRPDLFWVSIAVATLGNTLGGAVNYGLGFAIKNKGEPYQHWKWVEWLKKIGPKTLFLSWLPIVGDPLCSVAGWLKMPFWSCVFWMLVGKALRYVLITGLLMQVPESFWTGIWGGLLGLMK